MIRIRCQPYSRGVGLARAIVLRPQEGIPMLPKRLVDEGPRRGHLEPVDAVIVAETYEMAAGVSVPWIRLAGVVACTPPENVMRRLAAPAVLAPSEEIARIGDGELVLVDGDRGIVLVDPDGVTLAAYQAEREKVRPKKRVFLDFAHLPAATTDGRVIQIIASATCEEDLREGMSSGADAVFVEAKEALLPADASDDEQFDCLLRIGEALEGKPLIVMGTVHEIGMRSLLRAAQRMDVTLATVLISEEDGEALQSYIGEVRDELLEEENTFGDLRLAAAVTAGDTLDERLFGLGIERIVVGGLERMAETAALCEWLDELTTLASRSMVPVLAKTDLAGSRDLEPLAGLGVSGFVVSPGRLPGLKDRIRELSFRDCRDSFLGLR